MNNDLISKSHFDKRVREAVGMTIAELTADFKDGVRTTLELLKTEPTVDAVQVKQGRWIKCTHHYWEDRYECSKCGYDTEVDTLMGKPIYNFCPYCGAKMDGERKDDEIQITA